MKSSKGMKDKILNTVVRMILENEEVESLTVRGIAQEAGANIITLDLKTIYLIKLLIFA